MNYQGIIKTFAPLSDEQCLKILFVLHEDEMTGFKTGRTLRNRKRSPTKVPSEPFRCGPCVVGRKAGGNAVFSLSLRHLRRRQYAQRGALCRTGLQRLQHLSLKFASSIIHPIAKFLFNQKDAFFKASFFTQMVAVFALRKNQAAGRIKLFPKGEFDLFVISTLNLSDRVRES